MSDVKVNSVQPSEASKELVALYLLGSVAESRGATVINRGGIPYIERGMSKKQILQDYADCLYVVRNSISSRDYIREMPD